MWPNTGGYDSHPIDLRIVEDPTEAYDWFLRHHPIHEVPGVGVLFSRHRHVASLLGDKRMQNSTGSDDQGVTSRPFDEHRRLSMVETNPPHHDHLRGAFADAFTGTAVANLDDVIVRIVDSVLSKMEGKNSIDLVAEFATEIPLRVICQQMGIDAESLSTLKTWSADLMGGYQYTFDAATHWRADQATVCWYPFMRDLLRQNQGCPRRGGLMTDLANKLNEGQYTEAELVHNLVFLMAAGHEATARLIANGVHVLLQNPSQHQLLVDEPELVRTAVEEFCRFAPPLHLVARWPSEDVWVDDYCIPTGATAILLLAAANRDPEVFSDPERLDISRQPNPHLAFAAGVHNCLGSTLARVITRHAVGRLIERFPNLRLAGTPIRDKSILFRGWSQLPVSLHR